MQMFRGANQFEFAARIAGHPAPTGEELHERVDVSAE